MRQDGNRWKLAGVDHRGRMESARGSGTVAGRLAQCAGVDEAADPTS
jgi:hypothetical protein